jgi:serine/threonine protein kinase
VIGGFRVVRLLGEGGMGQVYEVVSLDKLQRRMALKVLPEWEGESTEERDSRLRRFFAEADMIADLDGVPRVTPIFTANQDRSVAFYVMKLIRGQDLRVRREKGPPLSPRDVAAYLRKVAESLAQVHRRGYVHRDIKPSNIVIAAGDGEPWLVDFGLSCRVRPDGGAVDAAASAGPGEGLTRQGRVPGTDGYIAPERYERPDVVERASDIYSLGVTLFELLTGARPAERDGVWDRRPLRAAGVPVALGNVVRRCLCREPARRYASADALREDLERFLNGRPCEAAKIVQEGPGGGGRGVGSIHQHTTRQDRPRR